MEKKKKSASLNFSQSVSIVTNYTCKSTYKCSRACLNYISNKESSDLRSSLNYTCIQSPLTESVAGKGMGRRKTDSSLVIPSQTAKLSEVHAIRYLRWLPRGCVEHSLHTTFPDYHGSKVNKVTSTSSRVCHTHIATTSTWKWGRIWGWALWLCAKQRTQTWESLDSNGTALHD